MISAPMPGSQALAKASSMPVLPPGWPSGAFLRTARNRPWTRIRRASPPIGAAVALSGWWLGAAP
jgi:hypothetical protein